jgi:predicted NBD/HSP70 family sugar kinase
MPLPSPDEALAMISADVEAFYEVAEQLSPGRVLGIGLARPYHLGAWLDRLDLNNPALKLWDDVDFAAALQNATGLDVHEENDGTAAAIAELFHGFGRECDDFAYFFLGPAIGGGVILNGDYRRGRSGNAGDVAMLPVPHSRLASAPPARGANEVLLTRASIAALVRHLAWHGHPVTELEALPAAIAACPLGFEEWLEDCVQALIGPMMAAQALLDVSNVVLDGDLGAEIMATLTERLRLAMARTMPEACVPPSLRLGTFGSNAHSLGAASLPLFIDFAPRAAVEANARPLKGGHDSRAA